MGNLFDALKKSGALGPSEKLPPDDSGSSPSLDQRTAALDHVRQDLASLLGLGPTPEPEPEWRDVFKPVAPPDEHVATPRFLGEGAGTAAEESYPRIQSPAQPAAPQPAPASAAPPPREGPVAGGRPAAAPSTAPPAAARSGPAQAKSQMPALWLMDPLNNRGMVENFRAFKTNVVNLKRQNNHSTFLLSGATPKVGNTTMVCNLGLVLAWDLTDSRTLIMDCNASFPSIHQAFGTRPGPGLMDYLLEGLAFTESLLPSPLPNLDLMPLGLTKRRIFSPFDLVRFGTLLEEAARHYDFVLLDSAPALRSSDTRIIASRVDGVILVAKGDETRYEVVNEMKSQLEANGAKVIGGVLNQRKFVIPKWMYRFI